MSPKKVFPNARRLGIEIHKFGGASLADAAAFRHAVEIVKTRDRPARRGRARRPRASPTSCLGWPRAPPPATATASAKEVEALRDRYRDILRGAAARGTQGSCATPQIDRSFDELAAAARQPHRCSRS